MKASDNEICGQSSSETNVIPFEALPQTRNQVRFKWQFPVDAIPEPYRTAVLEISAAIGVPVAIPAMSLLTTAGASIGSTRKIQAKDGWAEFPNLYSAIVGESGSGKTPAIKPVIEPVRKREAAWYAEYRTLPAEEQNVKIPRQLLVDDATIESIPPILEGNPRGVLWNRDELAGLFQDMGKYNKGADGTKSRLLSSYDSEPWRVDRKDRSRGCYIQRATMSILGAIQPKILQYIFKEQDIDGGLVQRFLWVVFERQSLSDWTALSI